MLENKIGGYQKLIEYQWDINQIIDGFVRSLGYWKKKRIKQIYSAHNKRNSSGRGEVDMKQKLNLNFYVLNVIRV